MKISEYQDLAMRTSPGDGHDRMLNGCLGLMGEAGEVVDVIKKWRFQSGVNPPFPKDALVKEIGDILWYCAEFCTGRGLDLARIIKEERDYITETAKGKGLVYVSITPEYDAFALYCACMKPYSSYYDLYGFPGKDHNLLRYDPANPFDDRGRENLPTPVYRAEYLKVCNKLPMLEKKYAPPKEYYDFIPLTIAEIVLRSASMLIAYADSTLIEAMERNIEKLRKRYPDGFDPERSLHRKE